ncbi:MAG: mechanosensitive ion channel family protein [Ferrovibrio sp.]|nr:mechanosensitive ion channel family protein [Ferrovibrio sp.]
MRRLFILMFLLLAAIGPLPVAAQTGPGASAAAYDQARLGMLRDLDRLDRQLNDPRLSDSDIDRLRSELEQQRDVVTKQRTAQREEATAAQTLLEALGPAPEANQPRESAAVAETRRQLTLRAQRAQDAVKETDLALVRLAAMQEKLTTESREQFTRRLAYRGTAPIVPDFWGQALTDLPTAWNEAMNALAPEALPGRTTLIQTALVAVAMLLLGLPLAALLRRRQGVNGLVTSPTAERRSVAALVEWLRRAAVPVAALWACYAVLNANGWLDAGPFGLLVGGLGYGLSLGLLATGLAGAALARRHPEWALIDLPSGERDSLLVRVKVFSLLALLGAPFVTLFGAHQTGSAGRDVVALVVTLYFLSFSLAIADRRLWRATTAEQRRLLVSWYSVLGIAVLALFALLLGYYSIGRFLAAGLLLTQLSFGTFLLLRLGFRDALKPAAESPSVELGDGQKPGSEAARRLSSTGRFMAGLAIDLLLLCGFIAMLLLAWGMSVSTLGGYALQLVYGVTIGSVTLSLVDVLVAVLLLAGGVGLTRFISGGLNMRLEGQTQIDAGVRNSIVTGVAYIGYVLSGILAVGALGLNLSNLAIIAGALSVGIGFGLQNIVNNFVSGLILLIERPVKVGDWVVVGGKEGYVRRINVRSTEIETFPRASVIVPNSELISTSVMNWTHRDKFGRVDIEIGLAYGSDVDKAETVLLGCLKQHKEILAYPPPYVVLRSFGDSALNFVMRGHIANVERRMTVESEIRKEIYKACLRNDIAIPYNQTDVHFADLDRIEGFLRDLKGKGRDGV